MQKMFGVKEDSPTVKEDSPTVKEDSTTVKEENPTVKKTIQLCNENPIYIFPEKEFHGLSPNFYIHVSVSNLYIPGSVYIFSCCRIGRSIMGICNSLTDT
jgi:hypothetical protein